MDSYSLTKRPPTGVRQSTILCPISLAENQWHDISTAITPDAFEVIANGVYIATIPCDLARLWTTPHTASKAIIAGEGGGGGRGVWAALRSGCVLHQDERFASNDTTLYESEFDFPSHACRIWGPFCLFPFYTDGFERDRRVCIGVNVVWT